MIWPFNKRAELPMVETPDRRVGDAAPRRNVRLMLEKSSIGGPGDYRVSFARDGVIVWTGGIDEACDALTGARQ